MTPYFPYKNCLRIVLGASLLFLIEQGHVQAQAKPASTTGYSKASYKVSQTGTFFKTWLIAGPVAISTDTIEPDNAAQEQAFKTDIISGVNVVAGKPLPPVNIKEKNLTWQLISSSQDIIDLDSIYKKKDYVYAYALAEINAPAATNILLAIGSDDGVKVWLNGKLVHDMWMPRGVVKDNDLVPLNLIKGSNQILLKIQDGNGGWGFVARIPDKAALSTQLSIAAGNGNLDKINMLLEAGADVNAPDENNITPLMAAKVSGRDDVVKLLLKKGGQDKPVPSAEVLTDNLYKELKGKTSPGIDILVAKDGKILYRKGFGYADIKNKVQVTPDTKFRIGSVTKQFTAAAILKLQENNLLSVNDKLSKFIPDFPRGDEVTIHQLLTHISGIHSYTGNDYFLDRVTSTISPDSLVSLIKKDPYDFNPGEKMLYNNSGYFLLGYIISKVSGKPYADYLKETFFDPLGMKNTGIHYAGIKLENEAKGYAGNSDNYKEALNWNMSWAGGAGAIYSTLDDLLKWNLALHSGKVLSQKSFEAATTPAVLKNGTPPSMKYGYGLGLNEYRGQATIGHSGGLHGFLTQLVYFPKEKLTIVMFTNTSEPEVNFDPNKIAELFLWDKMEKQQSFAELTDKPKNLQPLTGRYELMNIGVITVTTEDNKLFAQLSGQPKFEIFPRSEYDFFYKVVDAQLKFVPNDKGEIIETILFQNGQELHALKLKEVQVVEVNPEVFDKYIGKYRFKPDIVVTIFKENNKLFALPTGQAKLEMSPVSETDFIIKEINAKISFVKDENGKVNKLKLTMSGTDSDLPRIE